MVIIDDNVNDTPVNVPVTDEVIEEEEEITTTAFQEEVYSFLQKVLT